ncbi:S49 family peptidase [Endozoicomonas gorgoniicola]|uniref:S49 family peptidase n=1 Tax=Endozoicomonas gorgoniicola TaxID=1234144 RepID=A0ABT3MVN0_9GAMM|nr:S49 family peptidase [Endozoicomonas gorgoniicola]MCW7553410.1 S49 family peptidase [Endozoicomonas gorgoniicola]
MEDNWKESESVLSDKDDGKAWKLIENLAEGALKEQRRARRWGIFFKLLTFTWLFATIGIFYSAFRVDVPVMEPSGGHTALVDVSGVIADGNDASADVIVGGLRAAFEDPGTKGVILRINSPGGSPVQAGYIYDEIRRLRSKYPETPLYSVIMDIGASGGYYVAAAADEIYADKASLVGSIGVVSSGFGFVEAIDKLGITRRTYTAGEYKAFNDPFLPMDEEATTRWQESLDSIHHQFINAVKAGRGDRLTDDKVIFSGMVWTGENAVGLGLVDGLGSAGYVAREVVGNETIVDFTARLSPLEKFARDMGVSFSGAVIKTLGLEGVTLR